MPHVSSRDQGRAQPVHVPAVRRDSGASEPGSSLSSLRGEIAEAAETVTCFSLIIYCTRCTAVYSALKAKELPFRRVSLGGKKSGFCTSMVSKYYVGVVVVDFKEVSEMIT